jgi:hypothetical protein
MIYALGDKLEIFKTKALNKIIRSKRKSDGVK